MTQADGQTPTAAEVRLVMRGLKPRLEELTAALTVATRLDQHTPMERRYEVLAALTEAHEAVTEELQAIEETLGLPYERVLKVSYTAMFGPDD